MSLPVNLGTFGWGWVGCNGGFEIQRCSELESELESNSESELRGEAGISEAGDDTSSLFG